MQSRGVYPANPDPAEGASPSQLLDKVHRYLRPGLSAMVTGVLFEGGTFDASVVHLLYDLSGECTWIACITPYKTPAPGTILA
jgi:hypothetical protein